MKISILCSAEDHPINPYLSRWMDVHKSNHNIELSRCASELDGGEFLFLISCSEIVTENVRNKFKRSLVIHASDLPEGRGWSPHVWQILEGRKEIAVTLLEAEDEIDRGHVWRKLWCDIPDHALYDEINEQIFEAELLLMDFALECGVSFNPTAQDTTVAPTYYRRRVSEDGRLNPMTSLAEQFDLLRVSDPYRYPAFFDYRGHRYTVKIEKVN